MENQAACTPCVLIHTGSFCLETLNTLAAYFSSLHLYLSPSHKPCEAFFIVTAWQFSNLFWSVFLKQFSSFILVWWCWVCIAAHRAFSRCGEQAPLALGARPQWFWSRGLLGLQLVGSSWTGDRTCVPCIGRRILIHCVARKSLWPIKWICSILFCTLYCLLWFANSPGEGCRLSSIQQLTCMFGFDGKFMSPRIGSETSV